MKNEKNKLADDLMKAGFDRHEVPFEPMAWDKMKVLLDEDDELKPLLMVPENKSNHKHLLTILIIMSTLSILSIAGWMLFSPNTESFRQEDNALKSNQVIESGTTNSSNLNSRINSENKDLNSPFGQVSEQTKHSDNASNSRFKASNKVSHSVASGKHNRQHTMSAIQDNSSRLLEGSDTKTKSQGKLNDTPKGDGSSEKQPNKNPIDSVVSTLKDGKIHRVLIRKTWVEDEYRYVEVDSLKSVQDGFIGIHFTAQRPANVDSMSAGFNIQFMSGNRINHAYWGIYGGFDWGMQFYGKSQKSGVVLNNTRQDSGFTRLRSQSMDFFGRAHLEYAKYPIIPYFNVMAGPRMYYTNQQVASYVPLKETESSSTTNAHTSLSMMYGIGAGVRVRISKVVSLDMRYEWMSGTKVKQVDLNKSTFNGLNYNLVYNKANPTVEQFKFGLLFDLSSAEYKKELVKPGYYKETIYDSLILDPSDSNTIILPCNCKPCDNNSSYRPREYNQDDDNDESSSSGQNGSRGTRTNSGSGSSGSGKGSFPGIRPPAPKPTEKPN